MALSDAVASRRGRGSFVGILAKDHGSPFKEHLGELHFSAGTKSLSRTFILHAYWLKPPDSISGGPQDVIVTTNARRLEHM